MATETASAPTPERPGVLPGGDSLDRFALKLGEMGRLWRSHQERALKPLGISLIQWQVLHHLSRQTAAVMQRRLGSAIGVEEPVLVGVLDRLAAAGLVVRRAAVHDRRAKTVHLTAHAKVTLQAAEVELRRMRESLLEGVPAPDLDTSAALFDLIRERLCARSAKHRETAP